MADNERFKNKVLFKWLLWIAIFLIAVVVFFVAIETYNYRYHQRVYPGVSLGEWAVGGKTREQARALLQAKVDRLTEEGIKIYYQDKTATIYPSSYAAIESGALYELWSYDLDKTTERLYNAGREQHGWVGWQEKLSALLGSKKITPDYYWNQEAIKNILKDKFGQWENPGQEARLVWQGDEPTVGEEKNGTVFDYQTAIGQWQENLDRVENRPIELKLNNYQPKITKEAASGWLDKAKEVLNWAPVTIKYSSSSEEGKGLDKEWLITKNEWRDWLKIKDNGQGEIYLGVDDERAMEKLKEIAEQVDRPVKDARFVIQDGKVSEWQSAQDGWVVDMAETIKTIEQMILGGESSEVGLAMKIEKTDLTNESVNDLGIKELVGHGESSFAGSPKNRIHNIGVGAAALNGLLIKPGEEFSINQALGTVDGSTGYKQEMVIKGDKTIPEYGGGLCQIGTTLFRLAINTGLPITERRNHSYRVGYYEPAGTDATIYGPWPDLKFINDTGNYLLLQTRIEGTKAFFDFWGTDDGRKVATTTPVIYNIVKPAETKMVETDTLKPGEKKCTERAHNGADAYFKRAIIWPTEIGKEKVEETFRSHYVPWQEVCLVGKELTATATSTSEVIGN